MAKKSVGGKFVELLTWPNFAFGKLIVAKSEFAKHFMI
jgi:hypothetical protein